MRSTPLFRSWVHHRTGSVGGNAELQYLMSTYHAIKYDVPRFLDTCTGDARKTVKNLGVEMYAYER